MRVPQIKLTTKSVIWTSMPKIKTVIRLMLDPPLGVDHDVHSPVQRLVLMVNVDSLERTYVLDRNNPDCTVVGV